MSTLDCISYDPMQINVQYVPVLLMNIFFMLIKYPTMRVIFILITNIS